MPVPIIICLNLHKYIFVYYAKMYLCCQCIFPLNLITIFQADIELLNFQYATPKCCSIAMLQCRTSWLSTQAYNGEFDIGFLHTFLTKNSLCYIVRHRSDQRKEVYAMNKTDLISEIAEKSGLSKEDSEKAFNAFESAVTAELASGGKVQLMGFVTIEVVERAEREGRNPQSGEPMKIAAAKALRFKSGKSLKDSVNNH